MSILHCVVAWNGVILASVANNSLAGSGSGFQDADRKCRDVLRQLEPSPATQTHSYEGLVYNCLLKNGFQIVCSSDADFPRRVSFAMLSTVLKDLDSVGLAPGQIQGPAQKKTIAVVQAAMVCLLLFCLLGHGWSDSKQDKYTGARVDEIVGLRRNLAEVHEIARENVGMRVVSRS
jgi:hypothetical protein